MIKFTPLIPLLIVINSVTLISQAQNSQMFTDPRDGHQYQSIRIGNQTWMAENLAYLPGVNRVATGLFDKECRYVYGYDGVTTEEAKAMVNFRDFGVLYNWMAAKNACPEGWHLPSDREWMELERFAGISKEEIRERDWRSSGEAGMKLKSKTGWIKGIGSDSYGLGVLPGGCRGYAGFESKGYAAYFWTSSTIDGDNGWRRGFCADSQGISRQEDRRYFGCSVRCVKD